MKLCSKCNQTKDLSEFYTNGKTPAGTTKYKPNCIPCSAKAAKGHKLQTIDEILGELNIVLACEMCGYNKNRAALCFHHLDETEKEFSFSGTAMFSKEKLKNEIEKCVLLCHNCHMEEHYPHMNIMPK